MLGWKHIPIGVAVGTLTERVDAGRLNILRSA